MRKTSVDKPIIETDVEMNISGKMHTYRVITRVVWSEDEVPEYMGCIGKIIDIYEDHKDHTSDINDIMGVDIVTGVYTRSLVNASYTSAMETTCAEIGISSPFKPSGYPLPSYLS